MFLPGDKMEDDEELTYDSSAYKMYHAVSDLILLTLMWDTCIFAKNHGRLSWNYI